MRPSERTIIQGAWSRRKQGFSAMADVDIDKLMRVAAFIMSECSASRMCSAAEHLKTHEISREVSREFKGSNQ